MRSLWIYISLIIVVFHKVVYSDESCQCSNNKQSDQNLFCNADFAMQVYIKSKTTSKDKLIYEIAVIETYKLKRKNVRLETLQTSASKDECGLTELKENSVYIVSGMIKKRIMVLDACHSLLVEMSSITCKQLQNFREDYKKTCNSCQVHICVDKRSCKSSTKESCGVELAHYDCMNKHSICRRMGKKCIWKVVEVSILASCLNAKPAIPFMHLAVG